MNRPDATDTSSDRPIGVAWPWWRKTLAYLMLAGLAGLSIWLVDRKVHPPISYEEVPSLRASSGANSAAPAN